MVERKNLLRKLAGSTLAASMAFNPIAEVVAAKSDSNSDYYPPCTEFSSRSIMAADMITSNQKNLESLSVTPDDSRFIHDMVDRFLDTTAEPGFYDTFFQNLKEDPDKYFKIIKEEDEFSYFYFPEGVDSGLFPRLFHTSNYEITKNRDNKDIYKENNTIYMDIGIDKNLRSCTSSFDIFSPELMRNLLLKYFEIPEGMSDLAMKDMKYTFKKSDDLSGIDGIIWTSDNTLRLPDSDEYIDMKFNIGYQFEGMLYFGSSIELPAETLQGIQRQQKIVDYSRRIDNVNLNPSLVIFDSNLA